MINLKRIQPNTALYKWATDLLEESFPPCERRDDDFQLQVMEHPHYRLQAICNGEAPVGLAGYFETDSFIYFENFCISPACRNGGYGSATLKYLTSLGKRFILEIELPTDELTKRRKAFYERNGMVANPYAHVQPHYRKTDADLPLLVMSYKTPLTQEEYNAFRRYLDENVEVK